jgi:SAM-dependent methyltransferase
MRDPDSWDDEPSAEIYNEIARGGRLYPALARRLVDLLAPVRGARRAAAPGAASGPRYLDLATGTGLVASLLLARGGPDAAIAAVDASPAMLRVAGRELPLPAFAAVLADPGSLPFARHAFDGAACSAAFWHFPAPARVFAEIARVLAPGGRFALNVPAAQLAGVPDLPPAPLQLAIARFGRARLGEEASPAGPRRTAGDLVRAAAAAGLAPVREDVTDIEVPQREFADLLAVPAIGGRLFPDRGALEAAAVLREAVAAVDLEESVAVRWHAFVFDAPGGDVP